MDSTKWSAPLKIKQARPEAPEDLKAARNALWKFFSEANLTYRDCASHRSRTYSPELPHPGAIKKAINDLPNNPEFSGPVLESYLSPRFSSIGHAGANSIRITRIALERLMQDRLPDQVEEFLKAFDRVSEVLAKYFPSRLKGLPRGSLPIDTSPMRS